MVIFLTDSEQMRNHLNFDYGILLFCDAFKFAIGFCIATCYIHFDSTNARKYLTVTERKRENE